MSQHHFTTPEQAKALLELGVPQTSADMYCFRDVAGNLYYNMVPSWQPIFSKQRFWDNFPHDYIPIWSVGQLQWIIKVCATDDVEKEKAFTELGIFPGPQVNLLVQMFSENSPVMNLSKLED